jgi:hypothetical protein
MPQPTAPRPSSAADRATPESESTAPTKGLDLTVNKVIAGAGAAATSAVLGSYFGATGTVAGAALGSVASTVATTLYQHSLDRTRDTLVARVRLPGRRRTALSDAPTVQLTVPEQRTSAATEAATEAPTEARAEAPTEAPTTRLRVEPILRQPRRIWLWAGATVLVFVIGLLVVTGLEWAKGSSLTTGQPGTSVARVLTPASGGQDDRRETESTTEEPTPSAEPTTEAAPTDESTSTAEPTSTDDPDSSAEPSAPARENGRATATPTPSEEAPVPTGRRND